MLLLALFGIGLRADQVFRSGPTKASLLELYTSEGCSSCPPAEHWLSELREDAGVWKSVVPVAFHVTYWDNLGWPDKFAQKQFTDRQYAYSRAWRSESVYTPCFVRDGAEWKQREGMGPPLASAGILTANVSAEGVVEITFETDSDERGELHVWVARLVSDVASDVKRGENAGRKLRHDFTVVQLRSAKLSSREGKGLPHASLALPKDTLSGSGKPAVAVWVTRGEPPGEVLQATGGWLQP